MKTYKLLIVDENEEQIEDFISFIESVNKYDEFTNTVFTVESISKLDDENELFEFILKKDIDSVAFDYKLMENNANSFSQNGDKYQHTLLEHFENFPTFIITNNASDSKYMDADPFKIISKEIIHFDSEDLDQKNVATSLLLKIQQAIDKYKESIESIEKEFYSLISRQQQGEKLEPTEMARLIELDSKLEKSISKKSNLPKDWKSPSGIEAMLSIVSNAERILDELKKINND